jgi:ATP-dependent helicase/nuclease subunit A
MPQIQWNEEQLRAIAAGGRDILVSASAGTGKTAVLVERVIQRVMDERDPLNVDQLLLVTFTNAAAGEMRERIGRALSAFRDQKELRARAKRQHALLGNACISTLHAFCLDLVRQNAHRLGVDPQFRILDPMEGALLRNQIMDELLDSWYEEGHEGFDELLECYGGEKSDSELAALVFRLYEFALSQPRPWKWLDEAAANSGAEVWLAEVREHISATLLRARGYVSRGLRLAVSAGADAACILLLEQDMARLEEGLKAAGDGWDALQDYLAEMDFAAWPRRKKGEVLSDLDEIKELRDRAKELTVRLTRSYGGRRLESLFDELRAAAPAVRALGDLTRGLHAAFSRAKAARSAMDFSDIEHGALALLYDESEGETEIARGLQSRFHEILIDEYQDINEVQEWILSLTARKQPGNRFMVGDVKQSVYGFRMAAPQLFLEKYHAYREDAAGETGQLIRLRGNYRSGQAVVDAVNAVFSRVMKEDFGGIRYSGENELVVQGPLGFLEREDSEWGQAELLILDKEETSASVAEEADAQEDEPADAVEMEARLVGGRILEMLSSGIWDSRLQSLRPAEFRDMAVLLRSVRGTASVYMEVFQSMGIPAYAELSGGYFEAREVRTILSYLKVVDNPRQDIPLAALMLSPIFGFTPAELARTRLFRKKADLYEAVLWGARKGEEPLKTKLRELLRQIAGYRRQSAYGPMSGLIWRILEDTHYFESAGAMPGGARRQANLLFLIDRARQFEQTSLKGLYQFLNFIQNMEREGYDLGTAAVSGENENLVRILSVHRSKGLEFPVVFLCQAGRRFNMRDLSSDMLLHRTLGLGMRFVDFRQRIKYPTVAWEAIQLRLRKENLAEEARILYVAMTRARQTLIVAGSLKNAEKTCQAWRKEDFAPENAGSCLEWLAASLPPRIYKREDLPQGKKAPVSRDAVRQRLFEPLPDAEARALEYLSSRLEWVYSWKSAEILPAKTFASKPALSESLLEREPEFLREGAEKPLSGAEKGTALHVCLRRLDMNMPPDSRTLANYLDRLEAQGHLTRGQRESVDTDAILLFLKSPLAGRMRRADRLWREYHFTAPLAAGLLYPELPPALSQERIMLQGIMDCFFQEKDQWILVDYKTDRIPFDEALWIRKYWNQLNLYSLALEQLTGQKVKESIIYSFFSGKHLTIDLSKK